MQKLGQHFLRNADVLEKIVRATDVKAGDTIIEVGPGHGELTRPLAAAGEKIGASVIAVEKDEKMYSQLGNLGIKELQIIHGDILKILPEIIAQLPNSSIANFKIVGNIPYYITGYLLRVIGELNRKPERCVLMIQKEVAERICEKPPRMNRLAASVQFWAQPRRIASVPRAYFSPSPKVDSAVIELLAKDPQPKNSEQYYLAVRALFAQPRKTILNNLTAAGEATKDELTKSLASIGLDATLRPQNLHIEDIVKVAGALF